MDDGTKDQRGGVGQPPKKVMTILVAVKKEFERKPENIQTNLSRKVEEESEYVEEESDVERSLDDDQENSEEDNQKNDGETEENSTMLGKKYSPRRPVLTD